MCRFTEIVYEVDVYASHIAENMAYNRSVYITTLNIYGGAFM